MAAAIVSRQRLNLKNAYARIELEADTKHFYKKY
jgi:hypothetical protein